MLFRSSAIQFRVHPTDPRQQIPGSGEHARCAVCFLISTKPDPGARCSVPQSFGMSEAFTFFDQAILFAIDQFGRINLVKLEPVKIKIPLPGLIPVQKLLEFPVEIAMVTPVASVFIQKRGLPGTSSAVDHAELGRADRETPVLVLAVKRDQPARQHLKIRR